MVKDRTFEFRSTIDTISGGRLPQGGYSNVNTSINNQFLDKASNISREFAKISAKLEQLNKLAKNKSIFDDKPEEFEELSNVIKRELSLLNRRIQELKNTVTTSLQSPTQQTAQANNKTTLEHQRNVILILQNWTAQSFKTFENILEVRSQNLKSKKDRKDQFGSGNDGVAGNFLSFRASTPPAKSSPSTSSAASPLKQRPIDPTLSTVSTSSPSNSNVFAQAPVKHVDSSNPNRVLNMDHKKYEDQTHIAIDFSHQQQTLMMEQEPLLGTDSRNIRARNNALGAIESTINELGTIYQQLAHLVAEQGETVQRIDFNIEDMNMNVLSGQNQLARYLRRVNSNRFLIAKMFIAFIIFIIIFKFLFL